MEFYMVYGITDCPACLRACALLMEKEKEYVFVETDFSSTYRKQLKEQFKWNTFPIIVIIKEGGEEVIGGYTDLEYVIKKESIAPT